MSEPVDFRLNKASVAEIAEHLTRCDADFVPPLSPRVDIDGYANKIGQHATRFEAWAGGDLVGLVAAYCNDPERRSAYITTVSVQHPYQSSGLASTLMARCKEHVLSRGFEHVELEVDGDNAAAIDLYTKCGFEVGSAHGGMVRMHQDVRDETGMGTGRDFNAEIDDAAGHRYAYAFDLDVMQRFMIKSFAPFFRVGSLLELGSFRGDFTARLLPDFDDVTCVEVSDVAIEDARKKLGDRVAFVNSRLESVSLPRRYDNIVFTHVLEHIDEPVKVLRRINREWLEEHGRLFLACPNANAPSRQIAVKMGLVSHNAAVTPAEAAHGHRRTYSLDTLERDAVAAGLKVVHRSGIFFKTLANFQFDRLLATDIISESYLNGCYELGQQYPDLCSSIFLLCERGENR